jgi:hypothetical protein
VAVEHDRGGVPGGPRYPHRAVVAAAGDPLTVGAERDRAYPPPMAGQADGCGASGGVPDPHRAVRAATGHAAAVGAEGHAVHGAGVIAHHDRSGAGTQVPDPHPTVPRARHDPVAVRAERQREDCRAAGQLRRPGPAVHIPDRDRGRLMDHGQARAVPADRDGGETAR